MDRVYLQLTRHHLCHFTNTPMDRIPSRATRSLGPPMVSLISFMGLDVMGWNSPVRVVVSVSMLHTWHLWVPAPTALAVRTGFKIRCSCLCPSGFGWLEIVRNLVLPRTIRALSSR